MKKYKITVKTTRAGNVFTRAYVRKWYGWKMLQYDGEEMPLGMENNLMDRESAERAIKRHKRNLDPVKSTIYVE